jgi:signal transduction histidine kinase
MNETTPRIALLCSDSNRAAKLRARLVDYDWTDGRAGARLLVLAPADTAERLPLRNVGQPLLVLAPEDDFAAARHWFAAGAQDVLPAGASTEQIDAAIRKLLDRPGHAANAEPVGLAPELLHLRDVSQTASEGGELSVLFERIVATVAETLDADLVSLMLVEQDADDAAPVLRIKAARGLDEGVRERAAVPLGKSISGRVAATGQPLLIVDVEKAGLGVATNRARYTGKGLLSVPIKARQRTIGVLNVNNKAGGDPFDETDMALLTTLCNQAGLAIDNASLFETLLGRTRDLEHLNEQLRRISQAKSELIVNLTHEIKTPLTAIQGYIDLLRSGMVEKEKLPGVLEKVHERSRHLSRLAERLVTFFALDSGLATFYKRPFKFDVFAWKCIEEIRSRALAKQIDLDIDAPSLRHAVVGDEQHYRELLLALLDNALKFNQKGGALLMWGKPTDDDAMLEVFVADTGRGIAENLHDIIFEDFRQTDDIMTAKPDGLGLGLATAKSVTAGHGCDLRLVDTSPDGTTFAFTIPLHVDVEEVE